MNMNTNTNTYQFHDPTIGQMAEIAFDLGAMMTLVSLSSSAANAMLGALTGMGAYLSLHTGIPNTTGTGNEITPGTGYSGNRKSITWGSPALGVVLSSNSQTFVLSSIQASGILGFGLWDAATGGNYLGGGATAGLTGSIPSGASVVFAIGGVNLTVAG